MTRTVRAACLLSLAIGLLFVFVRAPHPWGWNGFDHYHELALALASGQPFPTMEVPWGYAYFLSAFYRLFGDRPWIPLLVQVGPQRDYVLFCRFPAGAPLEFDRRDGVDRRAAARRVLVQHGVRVDAVF